MKLLIISNNTEIINRLSADLYESISPAPEIDTAAVHKGRQKINADKPSVVLLDVDSLEAVSAEAYIRELAPKYYVPIVVMTADTSPKAALIKAGAVDVITHRPTENGDERFLKRITASIMNISSAMTVKKARSEYKSSKLIAIGGSTGSTNALPVILKALPRDCPPVVCVLHMPKGYTRIYAEQLNFSLQLDVKEAENGMYIKNGQVIIAAGGKHLKVFRDGKGYFIKTECGEKVSGHCPSVDVLFDSAAAAAKSDAVGVILTGMGSDGAKGMLSMKKAGAYNIAEDESTAIVYGMPKAAAENGAANIICPLNKIAAQILRKVRE